jgi:hypothetical protein
MVKNPTLAENRAELRRQMEAYRSLPQYFWMASVR